MTAIVNLDDTQIALVTTAPSGEQHIVQIASTWEGDECVGGQIIASFGPISPRDYLGDDYGGGPVDFQTYPDLLDRIAAVDWNLTDDDAEYLQAEDEAGRLAYPFGAR